MFYLPDVKRSGTPTLPTSLPLEARPSVFSLDQMPLNPINRLLVSATFCTLRVIHLASLAFLFLPQISVDGDKTTGPLEASRCRGCLKKTTPIFSSSKNFLALVSAKANSGTAHCSVVKLGASLRQFAPTAVMFGK